jgi:hypothetical protein
VIPRGERTAITVHNELNEATAIHWHGLEIESYYDGKFWMDLFLNRCLAKMDAGDRGRIDVPF